jgi:hypothetical protein
MRSELQYLTGWAHALLFVLAIGLIVRWRRRDLGPPASRRAIERAQRHNRLRQPKE